jgi:hypothetical protein
MIFDHFLRERFFYHKNWSIQQYLCSFRIFKLRQMIDL